jgi:hypothetical protein
MARERVEKTLIILEEDEVQRVFEVADEDDVEVIYEFITQVIAKKVEAALRRRCG